MMEVWFLALSCLLQATIKRITPVSSGFVKGSIDETIVLQTLQMLTKNENLDEMLESFMTDLLAHTGMFRTKKFVPYPLAGAIRSGLFLPRMKEVETFPSLDA